MQAYGSGGCRPAERGECMAQLHTALPYKTHSEVGQLVLQGVVQLAEARVALGLVVARKHHVGLGGSNKFD